MSNAATPLETQESIQKYFINWNHLLNCISF